MATVKHNVDLPVPADQVWAILADFGGFLNWAGGGQGTIEIVGEEGIGMIRRLDLPGLGIIAERLVARDPDAMLLSYEIAEGNPLGMKTYVAVVQLTDKGDGTCNIDWNGDMTAVEGADEAQVAESLKGSFMGMSDALVAYASR